MKPTTIFNQPYRSAPAQTMIRHVVLAFIVFAVIAFAGTTEAQAQIKQYQNNVFTNNGQGSVQDFADKLAKTKDALKDITLDVYVGYHADLNGEWCENFDKDEKTDVLGMKDKFPKANLKWLKSTKKMLTDDEIKSAVQKGNVFFTWCDSDTKVNSVMKSSMPAFVKTFN